MMREKFHYFRKEQSLEDKADLDTFMTWYDAERAN